MTAHARPETAVDVSVCIVSWNTRELLRSCLESIHRHTRHVTYEIIVVDNGSSDGTVEMLRRDFPAAALTVSETNLGFAGANNRAAREANGSALLFLNPDTELRTNAIHGMWRYLSEHPRIGAVGCRLLNSDGSIQLTCARTFPGGFRQFCYLSGLYRLFPRARCFTTIEQNFWDHADTREVDCLSGACMMLPRRLYADIGGFDETFFMYAEDVDLCYRVRAAGRGVAYLADELIYHHSGASSAQRRHPHFATVLPREAEYVFLKRRVGEGTARRYRLATAAGSCLRIAVAGGLWLCRAARREGRRDACMAASKYGALLRWSLGRLDAHSLVQR